MSGPFKNMKIEIFCKIDPDTRCVNVPIRVYGLKDESLMNFSEGNLSFVDMPKADQITLMQVQMALESAAHFVEKQRKEGGET